MKVDYKEIAKALSMSRPGVVMRSNREAWPHELEIVRGGQRKLFNASSLPKDVQIALNKYIQGQVHARQHAFLQEVRADMAAQASARQARGEENLKKLMEPLAPTVQARFDGRYEIVKSWEQFFNTTCPRNKSGRQMGKKASYWHYAKAFNDGELKGAMAVSAPVVQHFLPITGRAVQDWVANFAKNGLTGLIDRWDGKARKDRNVFTQTPRLEQTAVALMMDRPHISYMDLTALLAKAAVDQKTGEVLFEAPSYTATNRFCKAWKEKNAELFTAATNPDEWKNRYMVAFGDADEDVTRLNQRWEMDATPADWMLQDEDGGLRRYSVSVIIDVYSRRSLMVLSPTPRAETHKLALRLAILLWGVPEEIVTDNGKDYVSKSFLNALEMLDISHHRTKPFSPWEKPFVERMNQTMLHSVLEVYSSFVGHNVAERSAIEARTSFAERLFSKEAKLIEMAMPAQLLQERINKWLAGVYEQGEHDGIGMSPFAKAAQYQGEVRRVDDERALDVLLAPPAGKGSYVVTKKGLRIQRAQFLALELSLIVGKTVQVFLTDDYGQIVVYLDGKFVCVARCPERTGISRQEVAVHARQKQRQHIAAQRKTSKQLKLDPDALVSSLLQEKAEAAGKLVALPTSTTTHRTQALSAAGAAARMLDGHVTATEVPVDLQRLMDKRQSERDAAVSAPEPQTISVIPESPQLRFRQWLELDTLVSEGGMIDDPKLTRWYGTYPQTAEHASMIKRHQESVASGAQATVAPVLRISTKI